MLKIVDVHLSATVNGEYVVLQNQGLTTIPLRGCILTAEEYLAGDPVGIADAMYVFADDVQIKPYARVVLFTGTGQNGWYPTTDGKSAFVAYWGRNRCVWSCTTRIVLLQPACTRRIGVPAEVSLSLPG